MRAPTASRLIGRQGENHRHAWRTIGIIFVIIVARAMSGLLSAAESSSPVPSLARPLAVPFTAVKITGGFWRQRQLTNVLTTIPVVIQREEQSSELENFVLAGDAIAGHRHGSHAGSHGSDEHIYKALEAMAAAQTMPALGDQTVTAAQARIKAALDRWTEVVARAQETNGYIHTGREITGDPHWWDFNDEESASVGNLIEAGITEYQATAGGDPRLLNIAVRAADHMTATFGPPPLWKPAPGHEEVELALMKLGAFMDGQLGEGAGDKYRNLAKFFVDVHGDYAGRRGLAEDRIASQDQAPVKEQTVLVGHAVRAAYLWASVAQISAWTGDQGYGQALKTLWADMTEHQEYLTGGTGVAAFNEGFGGDDNLPNLGAYAETCATIGNAFWSREMTLLEQDGAYADNLERCLYNGVLSGVSLRGDAFFYVNPLESNGDVERKSWFGCSCCPPNLARVVATIGGYFYAQHGDELFINLYGSSEADILLQGRPLKVVQQTTYPWGGGVAITISPEAKKAFTVLVRIPGWSAANYSLKVNGKAVTNRAVKGYVAIHRIWRHGDRIDLGLDMRIRRTPGNPKVADDAGKVALERGPLAYCFEGVDLDRTADLAGCTLPQQATLTSAFEPDLLGGVMNIHAGAWNNAAGAPQDLLAVPYYVWGNRGKGKMQVWMRQ